MKKPIYFIKCDRCGTWRYTVKEVKRVKCLKCGKSIDFHKCIREIYNIESLKYAPEIVKRLKLRDAKQLDPYLRFGYD